MSRTHVGGNLSETGPHLEAPQHAAGMQHRRSDFARRSRRRRRAVLSYVIEFTSSFRGAPAQPRKLHGEDPRRPQGKSAEAGGLQIVIGLDDFTQLVFGAAVAAIGVGMMALHQFLEARLDVGAARVLLEPQRMERLALGIADGAPFRIGLGVIRDRRRRRGTGRTDRRRRPGVKRRLVLPFTRPAPPTIPIFQVGRWPVSESFW